MVKHTLQAILQARKLASCWQRYSQLKKEGGARVVHLNKDSIEAAVWIELLLSVVSM